MLALGSGMKLYCDSSHDESRILASGRRDSEIDTDRLFLELLAESAGEQFGMEISGEPPSTVRSSIDSREQLVDFFVHLFEVACMEDDVRAAVHSPEEALPRRTAEDADASLPPRTAEDADAGLPRRSADAKSRDFRADVERWLTAVSR